MASRIACVSFALTSPATTLTFQGWMLLPLGLRRATARSCSTVARSTGVGRNARTDFLVVMASSTRDRAASAGVMLDVLRIDRTQCFHAVRNLAEKQTLDVVVLQNIPRAAFIGDLPEVHDISAVGDSQGMRGLLLNHHDRHAGIAQGQ